MTLQLEFRYRDDDPYEAVQDAFDIIAEYLQPSSTTSAIKVAEKLTRLSPAKKVLKEGEERDSPAGFQEEFDEVFINTMQQVPYNNYRAQERLIELINRMINLSTFNPDGSRGRFWGFLAALPPTIEHQVFGPTTYEKYAASGRRVFAHVPFDEWVNINSIVARSWGKGVMRMAEDIAVRKIRDALENDADANEEVQQSHVDAGAQYMIHSASKVLHIMQGNIASIGPSRGFESTYFIGTKVFSMERWNFWKKGFQALADDGCSSAAQAVQSMIAAEG